MVVSRVGPLIKTAIEFGKRSGALASGQSFIRKYAPPGQRDRLIRVSKAFEQAAGGAGLYQVYQTLMSDDGTDIPHGLPPKRQFYASRPAYKTRSRRPRKCNCYRRKRSYTKGRRR